MPEKLVFKQVAISRMGFAGLVLDYSGFRICIDPGHEVHGCSVLLCTHSHARHCSGEAMVSAALLVSPFAGLVVKPGSTLSIEGFLIKALEAYNPPEAHAGNPPHPRGFGVGFLVEAPSGLTIYYTGDTSLVPEVLSIDTSVDVLAVPVGGGCVMFPEEALELTKSIRPSIAIPLHSEFREHYVKYKNLAQPYTQVVLLKSRGEL